MVKVLVACANGSEDIEAITPVNVMRRAGAEVVLAASGESKNVVLARGARIEADALLSEVTDQTFDLIVVPGGMPGAQHLHDDANLTALLRA
jgi:4-methyl-5(b-hydroxyethyl)-thiazole monophosphate biosynthesis